MTRGKTYRIRDRRVEQLLEKHPRLNGATEPHRRLERNLRTYVKAGDGGDRQALEP
jgi:hypothetical protein